MLKQYIAQIYPYIVTAVSSGVALKLLDMWRDRRKSKADADKVNAEAAQITAQTGKSQTEVVLGVARALEEHLDATLKRGQEFQDRFDKTAAVLSEKLVLIGRLEAEREEHLARIARMEKTIDELKLAVKISEERAEKTEVLARNIFQRLEALDQRVVNEVLPVVSEIQTLKQIMKANFGGLPA
jgi:uncharacterized pyridoxal phosphate-containing UPF0001 family protein